MKQHATQLCQWAFFQFIHDLYQRLGHANQNQIQNEEKETEILTDTPVKAIIANKNLLEKVNKSKI